MLFVLNCSVDSAQACHEHSHLLCEARASIQQQIALLRKARADLLQSAVLVIATCDNGVFEFPQDLRDRHHVAVGLSLSELRHSVTAMSHGQLDTDEILPQVFDNQESWAIEPILVVTLVGYSLNFHYLEGYRGDATSRRHAVTLH